MIERLAEAQRCFEQNDLNKSIEILNEHIHLNPNDISALQLRARIHYKMQRWGDAMNDFSSVLEFDPDNPSR